MHKQKTHIQVFVSQRRFKLRLQPTNAFGEVATHIKAGNTLMLSCTTLQLMRRIESDAFSRTRTFPQRILQPSFFRAQNLQPFTFSCTRPGGEISAPERHHLACIVSVSPLRLVSRGRPDARPLGTEAFLFPREEKKV
ncbi:hypothetical protein MTO96_027928 [Rhipicephalus appendiculatus]